MGGSNFRRREKKFSKKMQRTLDPAMLLSRGLSARFVGANVMQSITTLTKDEIEKDLRHMNAYYQANVAYAQQHYIYMNREELGATGQLPGGGTANSNNNNNNNMAPLTNNMTANIAVPPIAMPVRIDPEEEKRLQNLRKKIALCETQREFLESQYVSLRAHYVATTKELKAASKNCEGLVAFLQTVTKRRGRVLALQRAKLQIARDVLACLQTRLAVLEVAQAANGGADAAATAAAVTSNNNSDNHSKTEGTDTTTATKMEIDSPATTKEDKTKNNGTTATATSGGEDDIVEVWNQVEEMLKEAELSCRRIPSTLTINEKKAKKKAKKNAPPAEGEDEAIMGVIPWEGIKMPNTPEGVPLFLSQLSIVPEKGAGYSTNGAFGSNKASMAWMESSLPKTYNGKKERHKVALLRDEVALLEEELSNERAANKDIQVKIIDRRKRSDELVAMMTLLRSETEAILQRNNILLDSPQAKQAARELHEVLMKAREEAAKAAEAANAANGEAGGAAADDGKNTGSRNHTNSNKPSPEGKEKSRSSARHSSSIKNGDDDGGGSVGDDEGDGGDDFEEEGEVKGSGGNWGGNKRDLDEGTGDESSPSSTSRKRRKV
ncbi:expressed unknown protein [Seminavis robusta]|uniref:Uncharacterized protein n=1 Tax=Seminavis robusta TaxID=568900 RepID=A0A9N8DNI1_9STRA|nr:expressed unknown protein [Seminavis robusta]|eukprot:Sro260_g101530.1 n/a (608) ;mRNA; f:25855-27814